MKFPIVVLTQKVFRGGVSRKRILLLMVYYMRLMISMPFAFLQSLLYARKIEKTKITQPPVFILGHYRSGTTYLHKLMANDDRFCYLTNFDCLCPNVNILFGKKWQRMLQFIIDKFRIKNSYFNNSILQLGDPVEEDLYLVGKGSTYAAFWGIVFPHKWKEWLNCSAALADEHYKTQWKKEYLRALKKATHMNKGKQLVLKSPPHTERIPVLLEMFPDAKFIYISRNPVDLFFSMRNMWQVAIRKKVTLQSITDHEIEELIFQHYEYLIQRYEEDRHLIPEGNLIEVHFDDLERDPFSLIKMIYGILDLKDFNIVSTSLRERLEREKAYKKFHHQYDNATVKKVQARWRNFIEEWNYNQTEIVN